MWKLCARPRSHQLIISNLLLQRLLRVQRLRQSFSNSSMERVVVVVEDAAVARTALHWALHNLLRYGDVLTLLHVYPAAKSKSKKKHRRLRLNGFQLALSFTDICQAFPNTKTEIVVTEGDQDGRRIATVVREIGASTLVLGLHDRSFLYRFIMAQNNTISNLKCKVLAIKEPTTTTTLTSRAIPIQGCSSQLDFSQIEISTLSIPEIPSQKVPYHICPDPNAIIWRSRPSRIGKTS